MQTENLLLGNALLPAFSNKTIALLRNCVLVLSLAVATALSAAMKIEIGLIPITFQTFAVLMSSILFGSRIAAASQIAYLLGGLAGIPWFSRGGGLAYLLSPTFGYIIGFVVAVYVVGWLAQRGWSKNSATIVAAMTLGNAIIYLFGGLWLARLVPIASVLAVGIYPFILGDLLKIAAAGLFFPQAWKIVIKNSEWL